MEAETRRKLMAAVTLIEGTAQNERVYDMVVTNDWDGIEAHARDLRELIADLETEEEVVRRRDS